MTESAQSLHNLGVSPTRIRAKNGVFHITIKNNEMKAATFKLEASDPDNLCTYAFENDNIVVAAGDSKDVVLNVAFRKAQIIGVPVTCNFRVNATDQTGRGIDAEAQLESPSVVPAWIPVAGGIGVIAVIAIIVAVVGGGNEPTQQTTIITTTKPITTQPPATTAPATTSTPVTTAPPLILNSTVLPMGIVNQPYSKELTASGGKTPYIFTVSTGALPAGLKLTGLDDRCRIDGTPTEYGEYSVSITVRDSTTASPANAAFKLTVAPNLNGNWAMTTTVTTAGGVCSDEVGNTSTRTIKVEQDGLTLICSGFLGNPAIQLKGDVSIPSSASGGGKWIITIAGSYPEDGGTTTSTRVLTLITTNSMSGNEDWTWTGPGGDCPGGKATVTAQRATNQPSPFQGSISGSWSGQYTGTTPPLPQNGTFTVTIDANGNVQGTFAGSYSGLINGSVDLNGNLIATGTASGGMLVVSWQGLFIISGNSLSVQGNLTAQSFTGIFSGTGTKAA